MVQMKSTHFCSAVHLHGARALVMCSLSLSLSPSHGAESGSFSPVLSAKYKIRHWVVVTCHGIRQAGHGLIITTGNRDSEWG